MGGSSKKQTVGYKYRVGMHLGWVRGPIDYIFKFAWDKRTAWIGKAVSGDQVHINAPNLFGGEKQEGGVEGYIDVEFGEPTQGRNDYLAKYLDSKQSVGTAMDAVLAILFGVDANTATSTQATQAQQELVPAFRGFVGTVLRHFYVGMNPYLKNMAIFGQRVNVRQDGLEQWYKEKAAIPQSSFNGYSLCICLDQSGSMLDIVSGSTTRMDIQKAQVAASIRALAPSLVASGGSIGIAGYGQQTAPGSPDPKEFFVYNVSSDDVEAAAQFVESLTAGGAYNNTDWAVGMQSASDFFNGVSSSFDKNIIFITDGSPGRVGATPQQVTDEAIALRNAITNVALYGIGIDLAETSYLTQLDNTPEDGVPNVTSTGNDAVQQAIISALAKVLIFDMNLAHIIREAITDPDWGMGYPEADVDDTNFAEGADLFYSEAFGASYLWDRQSPVIEFIKEVSRTGNVVVKIDRKTGKFVLKPIRDDYEIGSLVTLDEEDSVVSVQSVEVPTFDELANSIVVKYWNNENDEVASTSLQNPALSVMQQKPNGATVNYPGITRKALADRIAYRDLKVLSTPLTTVTLYATRKAYNLSEGDPFILNLPTHKINNMVMRISEMSFGNGRDNRIKIKCTQDVFAFPDLQLIGDGSADGGWTNPNKDPLPAIYRLITEAPYYELVQRNGQSFVDNHLEANPEIGYLLASAARPATELNMDLLVNAGAGYEESGPIDFCPQVILAEAISESDTVVKYSSEIDITEITLGTHGQFEDELVRIDAIDLAAGTLTIGRGVLDTVPARHAANTVGLFWDAFAEGDEVEYVVSESLDVKLLPNNGADRVLEENAPVDTIVMNQRAYRPYPPGKVTINTENYPGWIVGSSINAAWAHRDRLQQTSGTLYDTTYGDIGPEIGTTYSLDLIRNDTEASLDSATGVSGTSQNLNTSGFEGWVTLKLKSVRGGLDSWQSHQIEFYAAATDVIETEDGFGIMSEDGAYLTIEDVA